MTPAETNSEITPVQVSTLKKRSDFLRLRKGRYCHRPTFILQSMGVKDAGDADNGYRVGYTVTTKCGNSVERSRIKRRLKAAVNRVFPLKAKPRNDYVVIAKRAALQADFGLIKKELSSALDQVHAKRANGAKPKDKSGNRPTANTDQETD